MHNDIYHSPYNITRKGNTNIHECTKGGTTYEKTTKITVKINTDSDDYLNDRW